MTGAALVLPVVNTSTRELHLVPVEAVQAAQLIKVINAASRMPR